MRRFFVSVVSLAVILAGAGAVRPGVTRAEPAAVSGPSREALQRARARLSSMAVKVQGLIERASGGAPTPTNCNDIRSESACNASRRGCQWDRSRERCVPRGRPENDFLALPALQVIQSQVNAVGEIVDKAALAYPAPEYLAQVGQACAGTVILRERIAKGRYLASLRIVGNVSPPDFDDLAQEGEAVRSDLQCP